MSIKKYKCKCCDIEFDEEEYKITQDENKCVLHCEKRKHNSTALNEMFYRKMKNLLDISISNKKKDLINFEYIFPDNIHRIFEELKKLDSIVFKNCHFYHYVPFLKNIEYFENCTFENGVMVSNREYCKYPYFQECKFKCNIDFDDGKNKSNEKIEFKGRIFKSCEFLGFKPKKNDKLFGNNIFMMILIL